MLLTAGLFKSEGRFQKVGPLTALAFLAAVAGVGLVALSPAGDVGRTRLGDYAANAPLALAGGVGLALAAAVLGSLNAIGFSWGADLAKDLPEPESLWNSPRLRIWNTTARSGRPGGRDFWNAWRTGGRFRTTAASVEVFSVVVGHVVCTVFAAQGLALIGFARDEAVILDTLYVRHGADVTQAHRWSLWGDR